MNMPRENKERQEKNQKQSDLRKRLDECETIVNHFDDCVIWNGLLADLKIQKEHLDKKWYLAKKYEDFELLKTMRITIEHVLALKQRYIDEVAGLRQELNALDVDITQDIEKDYDNEGNIER